MKTNLTTKKKVELIANGKIYIPKTIKLPYPFDKSTAGPGSGMRSLAFNIGEGQQVKLAISNNQKEEFSLFEENGCFQILKQKKIFLENIKNIPILFHAPNQAFINIENRCIYNCAFCNLTEIKNKNLKQYSEKDFVNLILAGSRRNDFKSIAITSGIYPTNKKIIKKICSIVEQIRIQLPETPIGVEPTIDSKYQIKQLKETGVDEIKINLQIPDEKLFKQICPELNYSHILQMLDYAVETFGRGKVTSNIIYGLGESDQSILNAVELLAQKGVATTLRKVWVNEFNKKNIKKAISREIPKVSSDQIINLALHQKQIFERYNLTPKTFKTMCHQCGCCDIVPFWDV